jgi:hypothetical protein
MNQYYNYYNMPMIPEVFLEVLDVRNRSSCVRLTNLFDDKLQNRR